MKISLRLQISHETASRCRCLRDHIGPENTFAAGTPNRSTPVLHCRAALQNDCALRDTRRDDEHLCHVYRLVGGLGRKQAVLKPEPAVDSGGIYDLYVS